jgi:molecular chaperone GrpE
LTENESTASKMADDTNAAGEGGADSVRAADPELADETNSVDEIETLKAEAQENWNKYLRTVAEMDNLRKRNAREVENARKYGIERLVTAILPVRDSLEAALKAAAEAEAGSVSIDTLIQGDEATLRLLNQALDGLGIEEIDPEGEPFDPERHEAMSMLPSPTVEPNSVMTVIQKGFSMHGRVVRPARVVVARAPGEED